MVNEILQWAALAILVLLVLGVMRQTSLLLPAEARAAPSGPPVGHRAPKELLHRLSEGNGSSTEGKVVAFVTEGDGGHQKLPTRGHETAH